MSGSSSRWGPCSWRPPRQPGLPALTRRCQKRGAERPSIPSAFVDVREADFDVLDPERHERAFPRRFDRGHCGGKFAVDSPLEGTGFELSVPPAKKESFPASYSIRRRARFRSGGRQRDTSRSSARSSRRWEGAEAERRGSPRPALVGKPLHASDGPFGSSGLRLSVAGRFRAS